MADKVKIGLHTLFLIGMTFMLTGVVIWLEVIDPHTLWTAALWFFAVPLMGLGFLGVFNVGVGFDKSPIWKVAGGIVLLTAILMVDWWVSVTFFQDTTPDSLLHAGSVGLSVGMGFFLIQIIFAVYEETFFTTIAGFLKAAQAPDFLVIILSAVVFTALHAWRYSLDLMFTIFLSLARVTLTAGMLKVDNTDINYGAHVLYNVLAGLVG